MRATLLSIFLSVNTLFLGAQDPGLKDILATGKSLWAQQGDRDGAASRFEQVLGALAPKSADLSPEWLRMLCEAHNWMAMLDDRVPARRPLAIKHLEALLELDPGFDVDRGATSARLQTVFDNLRQTRLGRLTLSLTPEGGSLLIQGKPVAIPTGPRFVRPGSFEITYQKPGYKALTQPITVEPKETKSISLHLERVSSTLTLAVCPPDATLSLDGKVIGQARPGAPPEAKATADKLGIPLEQLSADFLIDGVGSGEHLLEISAPCHRPRRLKIGAALSTPFADHVLEAIKLERAEGRLTVMCATSGGEVFLSGKSLGVLPLQPRLVCAGAYDMRVDFPEGGGFARRIQVPDGGALTVEVQPMPRVAVLGLVSTEEFAGRERFLGHLNTLGDKLNRVAYTPQGKAESVPDALARLRLSKLAELLLYFTPVKEQPVRTLEAVLTTLTGEETRWTLKPLDQDPLAPLVNSLNTIPVRYTPDAGLRLLDVPSQPGLWVLEASEAAKAAGIKTGLPVTLKAHPNVTRVSDYKALLAKLAEGSLDLLQEGRACTVPVTRQALELPLHGAPYAYPLLLADMRLRRATAKAPDAGYLAFHEAQVLMHFRRFDKALERLRETKLEAVEGVSQGTLAYYEGLCLMHLGQVFLPEARQAFSRAANFPKATLFGPDGPLVAPLARQMLDDIKP